MGRFVGLVGCVAAAGLAVAGCGGSQLAQGREGDIAFAQQMIPHHQQAVEMAEIALSKDDAPKAVTELAREVRREQGPEIVLMRSWLDEWGAEELPHTGAGGESGGDAEAEGDHEHLMSGMATGEQMVALAEAQGEEFESLWLELMIAHHEGAVEMASQVGATTEDPEVAALAAAVVSGQSEEIERMQDLRAR